MSRLAAIVCWFHDREPVPSMVMVDAQTVKGARYGPTFHEPGGRGGRTIGTKRTLLEGLALDIKVPPPGTSGFVPLRPLVKIEHAFAQLGRWRRLSRCYEGTEASARAWLEVASVGYLAWRASV
jgi:putative transposase